MSSKAPAIVVVDNDVSMRSSLVGLLQAAGYEVEGHAPAEAFLESGRLSSTACLILDVRMPGMSGVELLEHLERVGARIPIVFMTGDSASKLRSKATSARVVEFLEKPFSDDTLFDAIERAIRAAERCESG